MKRKPKQFQKKVIRKTKPPLPQRINKIIASAGLTSRRTADEWIKSGQVKVNGRVITEPGTKARWGFDRIEVQGRFISRPPEKLYLLLNKPFGYLCSLKDPQGRPLVTDLLKDIPQRLFPVGRLDFDTLGLLLFTNDGDWAHRLMHPRYHVPRTYKATVSGEINEEAVLLLRRGVRLEDGPSGGSKVTVISQNKKQSVVRITIAQGRSRQVRRMLETVGYQVVHLIRTGFGDLTLGDLKIGEYRHLETEEVLSLKRLVGMG